MPNFPPSREPVPDIASNVANETTAKIMREEAKKLEEYLENLIENPPAPAIKLKPRERHDWFMEKIAQTYPGDPFGMEAEIAVLMQEDYVDRYKAANQQLQQGIPYEVAGFPPLIASAPFINYLPGMLLGFKVWQKLFIRLHKQYTETPGA